MSKIERYVHHGKTVAVQSRLRGQHREYCLCWLNCKKFKPGEHDNCLVAQAVYANCVAFNTVTPVFECPEYLR